MMKMLTMKMMKTMISRSSGQEMKKRMGCEEPTKMMDVVWERATGEGSSSCGALLVDKMQSR